MLLTGVVAADERQAAHEGRQQHERHQPEEREVGIDAGHKRLEENAQRQADCRRNREQQIHLDEVEEFSEIDLPKPEKRLFDRRVLGNAGTRLVVVEGKETQNNHSYFVFPQSCCKVIQVLHEDDNYYIPL